MPYLKQCTTKWFVQWLQKRGIYYVVVESNIDRATVEGAGPYPIIGTPLEVIVTAPLQRCSNYDWIFRPFDEDR